MVSHHLQVIWTFLDYWCFLLTDFLTSWLTRWPTSLLLTYDVLRLGSPWEAGGAQQPEGLQDWVSNHQSPSDRVAVCISVMCVSWHRRAPMVPGCTYDLKYNFPLTPDLRWLDGWLVGWLVLLSMHFFVYIANCSITSWSYYHLLANSRNCLLLIFTYWLILTFSLILPLDLAY